MIWCIKCVLPDTRPGTVINEDGICDACKNSIKKTSEINWNTRRNEFEELINNFKNESNGFDCVIPVSGGKDSTWQVVKCLEFGLRPLAVTWKTSARTVIGQRNLDNLITLGVDHIDWQVNPKVEKIFLKKSFERYGSTAIPMHMALFNIPLKVATQFRIPLVIWGENSAFEYGTNDTNLTGYKLNSDWLKKYGVTHGTNACDWVDEDLSEKDLASYFGPSQKALDENNINAIFLGHYFKWDVKTSFDLAKKYGFKKNLRARTGIYDYADIDDDFISIHHWLKWFKYGITRSFDNLSLEIREHRITRDDAVKKLVELGEERPEKDIERFCEYIDIETSKFYEIAELFRNLDIWYKDDGIWKIRNYLTPNWKWT